jgi:hypothetical protein
MVRANPGIILLKNGTIVNKWHFHAVPDYEHLTKEYFLTAINDQLPYP